jgi:hypothetical protein
MHVPHCRELGSRLAVGKWRPFRRGVEPLRLALGQIAGARRLRLLGREKKREYKEDRGYERPHEAIVW